MDKCCGADDEEILVCTGEDIGVTPNFLIFSIITALSKAGQDL